MTRASVYYNELYHIHFFDERIEKILIFVKSDSSTDTNFRLTEVKIYSLKGVKRKVDTYICMYIFFWFSGKFYLKKSVR